MNDDKVALLLARRARLNGWLAGHHGVVPFERLRSFGFTRSAVYRMVDRAELQIMLPGVFRGSQWPQGPEQAMAAVCMRNPSAVIAHLTAARLWEFRKLPPDGNIHVLVPHGCTARWAGYIVHQSRQIDPVDVVTRIDGIRLTSPTRTVLDIADTVLDATTGSILEQLIGDRRGTMATHVATLARLGHPRRPGTRTLARVIASRPRWRVAMQSDLEVRVLAEIARRGLPTPAVQHPVVLPNGVTVHVDFGWPQFKEALEVDHPFWHAGAEESHRDKWRDRKVATVGWHTTRITDFDLDANLGETIDDVATILARATRRAV